MILGKIRYKDGVLQTPMAVDLKMVQPLYNEAATLQGGYYHRLRVAGGSDADLQRRLLVLRGQLLATPGARVLNTELRVVNVAGRVRHVMDVIYCVEAVDHEVGHVPTLAK